MPVRRSAFAPALALRRPVRGGGAATGVRFRETVYRKRTPLAGRRHLAPFMSPGCVPATARSGALRQAAVPAPRAAGRPTRAVWSGPTTVPPQRAGPPRPMGLNIKKK